jgi:hypothetical protein
MASYPESAAKINEKLKAALKDANLTEEQLSEVIDSFIWFGQVAKFRCRNNSAYDSFVRLTLKGIATVERGPMGGNFGEDFEVLRVTKVITEADKARKADEILKREAEREAMRLSLES